jgi:hypothetical protein
LSLSGFQRVSPGDIPSTWGSCRPSISTRSTQSSCSPSGRWNLEEQPPEDGRSLVNSSGYRFWASSLCLLDSANTHAASS